MKNNKWKICVSLLIALAFVAPSAAIASNIIEEPIVDAGDLEKDIRGEAMLMPNSPNAQAPGDITYEGTIFGHGDDIFDVEPDDVVPLVDCYTIYTKIGNEPGMGVAPIKPHIELYSLDEGENVIMYETSFEDNFDIYNNWIQIDGDCGIVGGHFDSFSWSDARASDGDHSMKSTMYDIYKGNQNDFLECTQEFNISDQYGVNVSFDVWVEGDYGYGGSYGWVYVPMDYLSFEIWNANTMTWVNPEDAVAYYDSEGNYIDGSYYFFDTTLGLYDADDEANLLVHAKDLGGGWWNVWFAANTSDGYLVDNGFDLTQLKFRFDWHTDPQFQYEGAYVDNFKVISVENVREKIFQSHSQGPVDWEECADFYAFEYPLEWCNFEIGCYELIIWCESLDETNHQPMFDWDDRVVLPFCVDNEYDCEITNMTIDDSFTGEVIAYGQYPDDIDTDPYLPEMTVGADMHIKFTYHQAGNVVGVDIPIKATAYKMVKEEVYATDFEGMVWSDTGAFGDNPILWHKTTVDSWDGSAALGCFNKANNHYMNDIYYQYVLGPSIDMENVKEAQMDYAYKMITEGPADFWRLLTMDSYANTVISITPAVPNSGYQPEWISKEQPQGVYEPWDIKDEFDYWHDVRGYFHNGDGSTNFDFPIGFVFLESDATGYTNLQAEDSECGHYWSGLYFDDVSVTTVSIGEEVWSDEMVIPGPLEPCTNVTDQFEWEDVPASRYLVTVESMCENDIDEDNNLMEQEFLIIEDLEKATDPKVESIDLTNIGFGEWGICTSDYDNYLATNADSQNYVADSNSIVVLAPGEGCEYYLDVSHLTHIKFSFDYWTDLEDGWDFVYLEYAAGFDPDEDLTELDWTVKETWTGFSNGWQYHNGMTGGNRINVNGDDTFALRFRLVSDEGVQHRGMMIDSFFIEDLFDITEPTDPLPVYEDFEDEMDDMLNWCNENMHYGQFWEYDDIAKEWCNEVPNLPINDALVWATDINDAYEAYLVIEHSYDFPTSVTSVSESFETGIWSIMDYGSVGGPWFTQMSYGTNQYTLGGVPTEPPGTGAYFAGFDVINGAGTEVVDEEIYSSAMDLSTVPAGADATFDWDYSFLDFWTYWGYPYNNLVCQIGLNSGGGSYGASSFDMVLATYTGPYSNPVQAHDHYEVDPTTLGTPSQVYLWVYVYAVGDSVAPGGACFGIDDIEVGYSVTSATAFVEISADGGDNWYILDKLHGTTSGSDVDRYDISQFAGSNLLIRFRIDGRDPCMDQTNYDPAFWCIQDIYIVGKKDTTAPDSTITMSGTMSDAGWYSTSVSCTITATDDYQVKEIHYILDGSETVVAGDTASFTITSNGVHNIEFWAIDTTGNVETPHNTVPTFRIDSGSPPTVAITAPEPGLYLFGNKLLSSSKVFIIGAFTTEATASDAESGVYRVQFYLDGDLISEDTELPFSAYCAVKHMGAGTIKVVAEDFSGNTAEDTLDITYYKFL